MKRFHWGVCGFGKNIKTKLIVCDLKNLDIKKQRPKPLTINLYLAKNKKIVSKSLYKLEDIKKLKNGLAIDKIFPRLKVSSSITFGYYSIYSEYGRYLCYSELSNNYGSVFKEHSF